MTSLHKNIVQSQQETGTCSPQTGNNRKTLQLVRVVYVLCGTKCNTFHNKPCQYLSVTYVDFSYLFFSYY